ncbi:hypothetical protein [Actinacidiphila oryziradicis]|uniref:Uncharacterized protein n=1 Tax=Actinacidiphila oryziradicis TaxID=2571141 RepID=A0A4U0RUH4_9ACTN|nr:hypothetical protein [Actinacidiphila oryziradicis]TJZ99127.1 hypothetical protein FCI23_47120 [Actinacidiphila oryziradicis]
MQVRLGVWRRPMGLAVPVVHLPDSPSTTARVDLPSDRRLRIVVGFVGTLGFLAVAIAVVAHGRV